MPYMYISAVFPSTKTADMKDMKIDIVTWENGNKSVEIAVENKTHYI